MGYLLHILIYIASIVSIEFFYYTNYFSKFKSQLTAIKKILSMIKNDHSINSISEKIIMESIALFKISLMNLITLIFIISPLLILGIVSYIFKIEDFFLLIASIKFEFFLFILFIIYILFRRKLINKIWKK